MRNPTVNDDHIFIAETKNAYNSNVVVVFFSSS